MLTGQCLHDLFESQVDRTPDQIALEFGVHSLSYRELDNAANRLAQHLHRLGVAADECIGFWLPRSVDVYITLLAILKAGAAYVPIDAEYPVERAEYILQDSQSRIFITTREFAARLTAYQGTLILIDEHATEIERQPPHRLSRPEAACKPNHLCYVIYTSGSTGKPKGVQIEHRSAVHLVMAEAEKFRLRSDDRVYQGFSIAFDASVEELWLAWCSGATLVGASSEMVHAGPDLPRVLTELRITVLSCVPTLLAMMEGELPTVRILIVGGEACSSDLIERWCSSSRKMFNTYGPTEATVIATWTECTPGQAVTIGTPLPGYTAAILEP